MFICRDCSNKQCRNCLEKQLEALQAQLDTIGELPDKWIISMKDPAIEDYDIGWNESIYFAIKDVEALLGKPE